MKKTIILAILLATSVTANYAMEQRSPSTTEAHTFDSAYAQLQNYLTQYLQAKSKQITKTYTIEMQLQEERQSLKDYQDNFNILLQGIQRTFNQNAQLLALNNIWEQYNAEFKKAYDANVAKQAQKTQAELVRALRAASHAKKPATTPATATPVTTPAAQAAPSPTGASTSTAVPAKALTKWHFNNLFSWLKRAPKPKAPVAKEEAKAPKKAKEPKKVKDVITSGQALEGIIKLLTGLQNSTNPTQPNIHWVKLFNERLKIILSEQNLTNAIMYYSQDHDGFLGVMQMVEQNIDAIMNKIDKSEKADKANNELLSNLVKIFKLNEKVKSMKAAHDKIQQEKKIKLTI